MPEKFKIQNSIIFTAIAGIIAVRIAGDILLILFGKQIQAPFNLWELVTSLTLIAVLLLLFVNNFRSQQRGNDNITDKYFRDFVRVLALSSGIIILNTFLPPGGTSYFKSQILTTFFLDIISASLIISGLYILYFYTKWILLRRQKDTLKYLNIIFWSLAGVLISNILNNSFSLKFFEVLEILLILTAVVTVFLISPKKSWLAVLPKKNKVKLMWLSVANLTAVITVLIISYDQDSYIYQAMSNYFQGSVILLLVPYTLVLIYFFKILLSTLGALPTAKIMENQTYEISSLSYLNRIVAESNDFSILIDTVTGMLLNITNAASAWAEIYKEDSIEIVTRKYINEDDIKKIHDLLGLKKLFENTVNPELIESIENRLAYQSETELPTQAKAMIVIPLFDKKVRIGTLVLLHSQEYGFEIENINTLTAFSNNISIALENARLVKESLEKEVYRQEILLAKHMQKKLLPEELPKIPDWSVAACSYPAKVVGGDYYDIVTLKNGSTCVLIGDVSGKGITAAFYMAQLKGIVMAMANNTDSAADLLRHINKTLFRVLEKRIYITLSALVVDENKKEAKFARAGHMPMLYKSGKDTQLLKPEGIGIGLTDSLIFDKHLEEVSIKLTAGDTFFMFTDGLSELKDANNNEFGYNSLKQILNYTVYNSAEGLSGKINGVLEDNNFGVNQHDDLTYVIMMYKPKNGTDFAVLSEQTTNI